MRESTTARRIFSPWWWPWRARPWRTRQTIFSNYSRARIQGLAAGYDLLIGNAWESVDLEQLVRAQLAHFGDLMGTRITVEGLTCASPKPPPSQLAWRCTNWPPMPASMAHSRTTVAVSPSHGTSSPADGGSESVFRLSWRESGGLRLPRRSAGVFGTSVIDKMIRLTLSAEVELNYESEGFQLVGHLPEPEHSRTERSQALICRPQRRLSLPKN